MSKKIKHTLDWVLYVMPLPFVLMVVFMGVVLALGWINSR